MNTSRVDPCKPVVSGGDDGRVPTGECDRKRDQVVDIVRQVQIGKPNPSSLYAGITTPIRLPL